MCQVLVRCAAIGVGLDATARRLGAAAVAAIVATTIKPPANDHIPNPGVTVSPTTASVAVGGSQQFAATVTDSQGQVLSGRAVTWSSSDQAVASVSGSGLARARRAGTTMVTATSEGRSGMATLTVHGGWPNEPVGFTVLSDWGFDALKGAGWGIAWNSGTGIGADPAAPGSPSLVWEVRYEQGFTGGGAPGTEYFEHAPAKEVYAGFWWRASNPWQSHPSSYVNKLAFWFTASNASSIHIEMYGPDPGNFYLHVVPQFPTGTARLTPNVTATRVTLGVWHRVEWYMRYATGPIRGDGVVLWWLDGVLQGRYANLRTPADAGFTEFKFSPTWGGIGDTKAQTDYFWFDHVRLSRR